MRRIDEMIKTKVDKVDINNRIQEIQSDEFLRRLTDGLNIEIYLSELLEFKKSIDHCSKCKSIHDCKQRTIGLKQSASRIDDHLEFTVSECKFSLEAQKRNNIKIKAMHLPNRILEMTSENIFKDIERKEILDYFNFFIKNYKNEFVKGAYICGLPGMGKTMLVSAMSNVLGKLGNSVIIAYFPDLIRELKSSIGDGTLETKILDLKETDILILDDIGGEKLSEYIRDEVLGPILNSRLMAEKPTFFTSNLTMKQLYEKYSSYGDKTEALRISERIKALSEQFILDGKKYRK